MRVRPILRSPLRSFRGCPSFSWGSPGLLVATLVLLLAPTAGAWDVPDRSAPIAAKAQRNPDLYIRNVFRRPAELPPESAAEVQQALSALGVSPAGARVDVRGGRFGTLLPTHPLLPGSGVGNDLRWAGGQPPANGAALRRGASSALRAYLHQRRAQLRIDVAELADPADVEVSSSGDLVQIHAGRVIDDVPVRNSYVTAVVSHGNLVLLGTHHWGDVRLSPRPQLPVEVARTAVAEHLGALTSGREWKKAELLIVPLARGTDLGQIPVGEGYDYRLAWAIRPDIPDDVGSWEALVDAHSGELLAFEDTNHYVASAREVKGGVYPVSNDGIFPDGQEQAGWPMPFVDVSQGSDTLTTDAGGNLLVCVDGTISTQLEGPSVRINDNCGVIDEISSDHIDLGTSGGTDCTTPPSGSPGDTHASRTGYHELNRIIEMARGHLPTNSWLQNQLRANMNINATCNAFWNGTVNFFKSGGGCSNTGEIAAVFDHEWGHGMDANDATPGVSNPGEGIADIFAALRLKESCIGRNFKPGINCTGFGDPCTQCTGVRDIDWAYRQSGQPHDVAWIDANCGTGAGTPCGGSTHCEGAVYAEAVWDLLTRDLPSEFGMGSNTALEIATRLSFLGSAGVGTWFQCDTSGNGGCNGSGGYLNYLAADDDDGDLNNGTPHMSAIHAAFARHGIACDNPAVQNSGCAGAPTTAPVVSAAALDRGASLNWNAVGGAQKYQIFRTDGVKACDFGKFKVGETTATSFADAGLQNGRAYSYVVAAVGASDTCMGPTSNCTAVTPTDGANLTIDANSATVLTQVGDADLFLDNCESGDIAFDIVNIGGITQNNVRIVDVESLSHPSVTVTNSSPAVASFLDPCSVATGSFGVAAEGLSHNETLQLRVTVTSDELDPHVASETLYLGLVESDFDSSPSTTFTFESGLEGWGVVEGTFTRTNSGGGAQGTNFYIASSDNLPDQCDHIRGPLMRLGSSSTLSVSSQFHIEPYHDPSAQWYDRGNVGLHDVVTGDRTPVDPDGGRLYNASGAGGTCGTAGQQGWADQALSWAESAWSSSALGAPSVAGEFVRLDIRYGTDPLIHGFGLHLDQVTVTDADIQVADTQSDICGPPPECNDGICEAGEDSCSCPADCGAPPSSENWNDPASCSDGVDDDCDGAADCSDLDCRASSACQCGNGSCDLGEDCNSCSADCVGGTNAGAVCGNAVCEAADGENCLNCPTDCNGVQDGKRSARFCCGTGGGDNPVGCNHLSCVTGGFSCTEDPAPAGQYCCGDFVCEDPEDSLSCELDCGPPTVCGDNVCEPPGEDVCSCSADCGAPPVEICTNGVSDDCDSLIDCNDPDCSGDPNCACEPKGASCSSDGDCCSSKCRGKPESKTCK